MKIYRTAFVIIAATVVAGVVAAQTLTSNELRGGGSWNTDGESKRSAQRWSVDLQRGEDASVSGLITAADSPLLQAGRLHGKLDGQVISGTIANEQGEHVARFNGILSREGFRGKYVDTTGEVGEWQWEGNLPVE